MSISVQKRLRERAKRDKKREKLEKVYERRERKEDGDDVAAADAVASDVDPDIAHITPGPQPKEDYEDEVDLSEMFPDLYPPKNPNEEQR